MTDNEILDAAERWASARVHAWSPTLRENLAAWLEPQLALVGDAEWGATGRRLTGLSVGTPLEWANRRIELTDGNWAITGIRFRGGDLARPFVDVIATSLEPRADGLGRLAEILPHYVDFAPLCLRVNAPDPMSLMAALDGAETVAGRAEVDLWIVAAPVGTLREHAMVNAGRAAAHVTLAHIEPDAAAVRTAEIYSDLAASRPGIAEWATPESVESLAACAEEGLLFEVLADGVPAGIAALARDDSFGLRGWCVQEICLDGAHRGRRLAPVVLAELARRLPNVSDVLWGHIHPANQPSLRNALAAGREIVGAQLWFTPERCRGMQDSLV